MDEHGNTIDRKYEIVQKIGGGGFSEVYLVKGASGECALKLLKNIGASGSQTALTEFKNEFSVLKNLNHPHIARILDFGFDEKSGRYYYTSEMIRGSTIFEATEQSSVEQVIDLIVQALRALEYLHSFRIYHFDIKAANVLVLPGEQPRVKLIDFGLAGIDPRGRLIGTPSYMSPEIINREQADGRADLYSLGVLWYFCLAKFNPFRAKEPRETLANQVRVMPPPPSTFNRDVAAWIDAILGRLLQKNPAKRYASAAHVLREINRLSPKKYPMETRETLVSYLPQEGELIGRAREMTMVRDALKDVSEGDQRSASLLVEGAQGSGKTRFLKEFKYEVQLKDVRVNMAGAADADEYRAWSEALGVHISEGRGLKVFILDDAHLLGADEAAAQQFMGMAARAHRPAGDARLMLLVGSNPAADDSVREMLSAATERQMTLGSFTREELTAYLASLTGLDKPPPQLVEEMYKRTDGNPLFVTEVLKALIQGGGLFDEGGRWRDTVFEDIGVDFSKAEIPPTVEGLLLKRIELLDDNERSVVQALAAARRPSSAEQLGAYAAVADPVSALQGLMQKELVDRIDEHRFAFRNELLGHVVYSTTPEDARAVYHDRIADALASENGPFEAVAHHRAFGTIETAALKSARELGEYYLKRGIGRKAARYFARAQEYVPLGAIEERVDILLKLGEALLIGKDFVAAEAMFGQIEVLLPKLAESEHAAKAHVETLVRLGGTYMKIMAFSRARALFTEAKVKLHTTVIDPAKEIYVENFLGSVLMSEGRYREALDTFERTRNEWKTLSFDERTHIANNDLGMARMALGDYRGAAEAFDEDLSIAQEMNDDLLIGRALYNLAQLAVAEGRHDDAVEKYKECIEVCRRSENTELLLRAYNGIGNICQSKGDLDESAAYYERGFALHERAGDLRGGAAIGINIGIVENARRSYDAALDALIPAVEFIKGLRDKTGADWAALSRGYLELGDVYRNRGEFSESTEALGRAYDIAVSHEAARGMRFWILMTLAEVAHAQGDQLKLKSLVVQMRPIATGALERDRLETFERELVAEGISISRVEHRAPHDGSVRAGVSAQPRETAQKDTKTAKQTKAIEKSPKTQTPLATKQDTSDKASRRSSREGGAPSVEISEGSEERPRRSPLEKILEINKLIGAERDLGYVLKTVIYYAIELAGAESGAVILLDDAGELELACHRNMDGRDDEMAFSRGLARRVLEEGEAIVTEDALEDARFASEESVAAHALRSIMCMPVRARNKIIGVLYLDHRFTPGAFAYADRRIIEAFADQAGLAIENARLIEMLSRRKDALSAELSAASMRIEYFEGMLKEKKVLPARGAAEMRVSHERLMIDAHNAYDPNLTWYDYQKIIVAKAYAASGAHAVRAAAKLGISSATMYKYIGELGLKDADNEIFRAAFVCVEGMKLADYQPPIFKAALEYARGRTMQAIANLGISQGHFYKVMRADMTKGSSIS